MAINGKAFQHLQQNDAGLMKTVFHKAVVYSRMSPLHKAELVVGLQELGLTVGMCGDGANVSTSIGVTWASLLTYRLGLRCSEGS